MEKIPRQPRFGGKRSTETISISDRALTILRALARFRFLNINQMVTLLDIEQRTYDLPPVSHQKVSRLLQKLNFYSYVDRVLGPVTNLTEFSAVRRLPTTYALAKNGAKHLEVTNRAPLAHLDWRRKNRLVHSSHIDHTTGVADFVIAFLSASKELGFGLIDHHDLLPYFPPPEREGSRFTLSVTVDGIDYTRRPDRLLALVDGKGERQYFAHEWHSGEVPGRRSPDALWRGFQQSNFSETIWIYWQAREAGIFQSLWGANNLRVLTVTASDESIVNLSKQVARITGRPQTRLFLFTTPSRLFRDGPFAPIWFAPQNAFDAGRGRHTVNALRAATPNSLLNTPIPPPNNPP